MKQLSNWSTNLLWIIDLALLAVLLPHTAWAFSRFEPQANGWLGVSWGTLTAWADTCTSQAAMAMFSYPLNDQR